MSLWYTKKDPIWGVFLSKKPVILFFFSANLHTMWNKSFGYTERQLGRFGMSHLTHRICQSFPLPSPNHQKHQPFVQAMVCAFGDVGHSAVADQ